MTKRTGAQASKGRPSAEESAKKLKSILDVARQQFARNGYRAVTMRGVAEAANVSTRTLYNRYADKLALFRACLDSAGESFPGPRIPRGLKPRDALPQFAVSLVRQLSSKMSISLGILVYREGQDFPELMEAADANQDAFLVQPLAAYLRGHGLEEAGSCERAKLFIAMVISEFQRRISFGKPQQTLKEMEEHAQLATALFLGGARKSLAVASGAY